MELYRLDAYGDYVELSSSDEDDVAEWLNDANGNWQAFDRTSSNDDRDMAEYLKREGWYVFESADDAIDWLREYDEPPPPEEVEAFGRNYGLVKRDGIVYLYEGYCHLLRLEADGVHLSFGYEGVLPHDEEGVVRVWPHGAEELQQLMAELQPMLSPAADGQWMATAEGSTAFGSTPLEACQQLQRALQREEVAAG